MDQNLISKLLVLQELIYQSTIDNPNNWIRFPKDSEMHILIGRGQLDGIDLSMVYEIDENTLELRPNK